MKGTVKPLGPRREANTDAGAFHREVVREFGRLCWFNGVQTLRSASGVRRPRKPHERCEGRNAQVIHAMHLVRRSQLGPKSRYALPTVNGRPGCGTCHRLEDAGFLAFTDREYNQAVDALNVAFSGLGLKRRVRERRGAA